MMFRVKGTPSEAEAALQQIQATYPSLDMWQHRAQRNPPEQPEHGSELAIDDRVFRWHPVSEAVRLSLISAGEHLRLARTAIEAGELYPSAHFTAMRGALVGASQAVWVLGPDDPEIRQERGLTLIGEGYGQLLKYYTDLQAAQRASDQERALSEQIEWCRLRQQQALSAQRGKQKLNQTAIISWALECRFDDEARRSAGRSLWREMSADAHILMWALYQRSAFQAPDRRTGLAIGLAGGSIEHIAEAFLCSYLLLSHGWSLFDRRCEAKA